MKAFDAFADAESAPIPPLKCVMLPSSPGSGPTSCAPAFGTISDACAMPSSTSPFATRSGDCARSEEHTSELQSRQYLVCRLLLEKKKKHESCNIHQGQNS